ncbi:PEP-CTERM sorting domain-containing protein [Bythopirellula goksoeyrii]|uniref:PEP-CTERM motif protein n=1 Tax=Bythopirellula goksoeyrii TaxID=1400387 RepID=A0A5B9Q906_9BACT|nr:PEP-CTERM sorting domain-containing protein [Bythopirellula goksoeyrii]QEG35408.1 PEP-CTERM motif protein [Bythopirellula goksoeyrii]
MSTLPRQLRFGVSPFGMAILSAVIFASNSGTVSAAISLTSDPALDFADVYTTNPSAYSTAEHAFVETRMLRQTFKNDAAFDIGQAVLSLRLSGTDGTANSGAGEGGLMISLYQVDDVNATTWTAALGASSPTPFHSWTIPQTTSIPATSDRLGLTFTGADVINLPVRNTGTTGYGIEISSLDGVTSMGGLRVTASGIDDYADGVFYREDGTISRPERDAGLALIAEGALAAVPGDVDNDREVDLDDFTIISDNLRNLVGGRLQGDLTGDGVVDFNDFREWKSNVPPLIAASAVVPEPSSWMLALAGFLLAGWRKRRDWKVPTFSRCRFASCKVQAGALVSTLFIAHCSIAQAAITFTSDGGYPPSPTMGTPLVDQAGVEGTFTLDPQQFSVAGRGISGTRQLRQSFQVAETFYVGGIILSHAHGAGQGGYIIDFYNVDDVTTSTWTPNGAPFKTITVPNTVNVPSSSTTLEFVLSGADSFTLDARGDVGNSDNAGYGIEVSNFDESTNNGNWFHSNNGTDNYTAGRYYIENGNTSNNRDFGFALRTTDVQPPGPGDVNEDQAVDLADLQVIRSNFGQTPATRIEGDLSSNNLVFFEDFREWKNNYPPANPIAALSTSTQVPEPSTVLLAMLGFAGWGSLARRRS